jgi:ABC-2 type transport system ATP-binding protein
VREIKSRYKRDRVLIEYEGDGSFLQHPAIASVQTFVGHTEFQMKDGADPQLVLRAAVNDANAKIYRFDLKEPSLEEIFIQTVGGKFDE